MSVIRKFPILSLLKGLYTPASLIFIFIFSWKNFALLENLITNASIIGIFLAIFLWSTAHLLSPLLSKSILSSLNSPITYKKLLQIHASRLPARYVPGGIWHTVGRIADLHLEGVSRQDLTFLIAAESIIPLLMAFTMGGSYLWFSNSSKGYSLLFGVLFTASLSAIVILPLFFAKKINSSNNLIPIYLKSLLVSFCFWLVASSSFTAYYLSFPLTIDKISFLTVPAAYIFSWGIGYIAIFAPQGIGVFEFVAGNILNLPTTLSGTIVVLAGFRLVNLISDITVWSTCHFFLRVIPGNKQGKTD
jgi:glycosyltransferase 2 family protein